MKGGLCRKESKGNVFDYAWFSREYRHDQANNSTYTFIITVELEIVTKKAVIFMAEAHK